MNAYLVLSRDTHTYRSNDYYEPDDICSIAEIVVAPSRGRARYLAWKKHLNRCYVDGFWNEHWDTTRIIERNVDAEEGVVEGTKLATELWKKVMSEGICPEHGEYEGDYCSAFIIDEINYESIGICGFST